MNATQVFEKRKIAVAIGLLPREPRHLSANESKNKRSASNECYTSF